MNLRVMGCFSPLDTHTDSKLGARGKVWMYGLQAEVTRYEYERGMGAERDNPTMS